MSFFQRELQAQVMSARVGPGIGSSMSIVPSIAKGIPIKNGGSWQYGFGLMSLLLNLIS
ncbi:hypothetical protein Q4557_07220 [Shewanella sp. 5_MG-2023]|uniref:hypothetical protein n=1 Tax=Shewanella sp. 5_MG-2023 TaxID=3062656 RepID=UPI0026E41607|nr:hypothetical protein [Shewanella sp. 5_MG-2023]MDO6639750.1 hypothetical protein [Shewanella sp. 5_MG-2023]